MDIKRVTVLFLVFLSILVTSPLLSSTIFAADINDGLCSEFSQGKIKTQDSVKPEYCEGQTDMQGKNPLFGAGSLGNTIIQTIIFFVGAASVIMIVISGFRYVISGGDPTGVAGAKNSIIYAVVGLVVAISGQIIVSFVLSRLQ